MGNNLVLGEGAIIWRKHFMALALKYRLLFTQKFDYDHFFAMVSTNFGMLDCFCEMYRIYVQDQVIEPIEKMQQQDKENLWAEAKRLLGPEAEKKTSLKICKAIVFLSAFLQQDIDPQEEQIALGELRNCL